MSHVASPSSRINHRYYYKYYHNIHCCMHRRSSHRRGESLLLLLFLCSLTMRGLGFSSSRATCGQALGLRSTWSISMATSSTSSLFATQRTEQERERERIRQSKHQQLMEATKLSLAPMMDYTDRHFRHVVRLVSSRTLVYTEMVAANAIAHETKDCQDTYLRNYPEASLKELRQGYSHHYLQRYLAQGKVAPFEGPSVLQLGGSDPQQMHTAAQTVMDMTERGLCDYTAINLNCGCPSPKVAGKGCFGAALMEEPSLVAELTKALHDGSDGTMPITVKCRIGTDVDRPFTKMGYTADMDSPQDHEYRKLCHFIETVASNGIVTDFSVHARIAVLQKSFSPADNRKIPPLRYDVVRRLVQDFPDLTFSLNGGIDTISQAQAQFDACPGLAGVMIGRSWAADPWSFAMADQLLFSAASGRTSHNNNNNHNNHNINRLKVLQAYGEHADWEEAHGDPLKIRRFLTKAISSLFTGEPNAKRYRIALDEIATLPKKLDAQGKTLEGYPPLSELILNAAYEHLSEDVLLRSPEESYDRKVALEKKNNNGNPGQWSEAVAEWQSQRKQEADESAASASSAAA